MKKLALVLVCAGLSTGAMAQSQQGFVPSDSQQLKTVSAALNANDETLVILKGKIKKALKDEHYLFADNSGEIRLEIDDEVWQGIQVDEKTTITVYGEVDKDWNDIEIDVKRITLNK